MPNILPIQQTKIYKNSQLSRSYIKKYVQNTIFTIISIGTRLACKPIQIISHFLKMKKFDKKYTFNQIAIKQFIIQGLKNDMRNYVILLPAKDYVNTKIYGIMDNKQSGMSVAMLINLSAPALVNAVVGIVTYNLYLHKILQVNLIMDQYKIRNILRQRKQSKLTIIKQTFKFRYIGLLPSCIGYSISAAINIGIFDISQQLYLKPISNIFIISIIFGTMTGYTARYVDAICQFTSYLKKKSKVFTNQPNIYQTQSYSQILRKEYKQIINRNIPIIWSLSNGIILTMYQYLKQNYRQYQQKQL